MSLFGTADMNARRQGGLTLLELIIGISVLGILLAVGVPSFQSTVDSNRLAAQTNSLVTALNLARSEAVKRGQPVSICASTNQTSCSGATAWTTGWIAFTDANGAAGAVNAPGDTVLQAWQALSGPAALNSTVAYIQYQPNGRSIAPAAISFQLMKPDCSGPYSRTISVAVSGRVDSEKGNCPP